MNCQLIPYTDSRGKGGTVKVNSGFGSYEKARCPFRPGELYCSTDCVHCSFDADAGKIRITCGRGVTFDMAGFAPTEA